MCLEIKRNEQQESIRQAIRKELVTRGKLVQYTVDRRKFIIIFGFLEKQITSRVDRVEEEIKVI